MTNADFTKTLSNQKIARFGSDKNLQLKKQLTAKKSKKSEQKKNTSANKEGKPQDIERKLEEENANNKKPKLSLNIKIGNKNG